MTSPTAPSLSTATPEVARQWLRLQRAAVLVSVAAAQGSTPREPGARMLVSHDQIAGTVGGGHLELKAIERAREMLASGKLELYTEHVSLGPSLGQCCGGTMTLAFERLNESHLLGWAQPVRFHLQLYGAGHVGRAVARLLATLAVRVDWIDERGDEFPASLGEGGWPAHIRRLAVEEAEHEVRHAPANAFYLVMTHRHDLDQRIVDTILQRGDFGFLGLIGSRTKKQRFIHRLEERGHEAALIERIVCPIGVPGIAGKEPEVIAVAAVAQLLQRA